MEKVLVGSEAAFQEVVSRIYEQWQKHGYVYVDLSTERQRTKPQNAAIHVYFRLLADALNNSGLDMRRTLKPEVEIPWTDKSVKEYLWRPIQELVVGKDSTTKLTTAQVSEVYEVLSRHLATKFGIWLPFPEVEYGA